MKKIPTFMLAGYCVRYHNGVMPNRSIAMADPKLSHYGEDLLFFARTYIAGNVFRLHEPLIPRAR